MLDELSFFELFIIFLALALSALTSIVILRESLERFQFITLLGLSFLNFTIGLGLRSIHDLQPIIFPNFMDALLFSGGALFFFILGFSLLWFHQILTRYQQIPPVVLFHASGTMASALAILILDLARLIDEGNSHLVLYILLILIAIPSLSHTVLMSLNDFEIINQKTLSVVEIFGYMGWTVGLVGDAIPLRFTGLINEIFWNLITILGVTLILFLYLKDQAFLHKVSRKIMYVSCYLDSGISFFHASLHHRYLINEVQDSSILVTGGILSAIDSIFRQLLQQEVVRGQHVGKRYCLYLQRNEKKRVAIIFLGDQIPYYLQLAAQRFLDSLPEELTTSINGPVLDQNSINVIILPLFEKFFPYLALASGERTQQQFSAKRD